MDKSSTTSDDKEKYLDGAHIDSDVVEGLKVKEDAPESYYVSRYGALGPILEKMFASGVEARGVERVPEDQRSMKNSWNKYVWRSVNGV